MTHSAPPIADPHSTASQPLETGPRTLGTIINGLVHVALGAPVIAAALLFANTLFLSGVRYHYHVSSLLSGALLVLFLLFLGGTLVVQGLRIWKYGR